MSDKIILRGNEIELDSAAVHEFVVSACQAAEGLIQDSELAEKYELVLINPVLQSRLAECPLRSESD